MVKYLKKQSHYKNAGYKNDNFPSLFIHGFQPSEFHAIHGQFDCNNSTSTDKYTTLDDEIFISPICNACSDVEFVINDTSKNISFMISIFIYTLYCDSDTWFKSIMHKNTLEFYNKLYQYYACYPK